MSGKMTRGCVGLRLQWCPDEIEGWQHGDQNCNEFTSGTLGDTGWPDGIPELPTKVWDDGYFKWSQGTVTGEVYGEDEEFVYIMLNEPMGGEYFSVAYPKQLITLEHVVEHKEGT